MSNNDLTSISEQSIEVRTPNYRKQNSLQQTCSLHDFNESQDFVNEICKLHEEEVFK
ncbi:14631_t:CDS:1, partial [Gigaspora rosea]